MIFFWRRKWQERRLDVLLSRELAQTLDDDDARELERLAKRLKLTGAEMEERRRRVAVSVAAEQTKAIIAHNHAIRSTATQAEIESPESIAARIREAEGMEDAAREQHLKEECALNDGDWIIRPAQSGRNRRQTDEPSESGAGVREIDGIAHGSAVSPFRSEGNSFDRF